MAGGVLPLPGVVSRRHAPARWLPTAPGAWSAPLRRAVRATVSAQLTVVGLVVGLTALGSLTGRWGLVPVLTGSMRPGIQPGDLVLVVPEATTAVEPGQVVLFRPPGNGEPVVHRVLAVSDAGGVPAIRTKGDANNVADPWNARLPGSRAWRVRAVVPDAGYLAVAEHDPAVRLALELALLAAGVGTGLSVIWRRPGEGPGRLPAWVPSC